MKSRILTGVAIALALAGVFYLGQTALFILILALNAFSLTEYMSLAYNKGSFDYILAAGFGTAMIVSCQFYEEGWLIPAYTASALLFFAKDVLRGRSSLSEAAIGVWGLTAISLSCSLAVIILHKGILIFGLVIFATCLCDIAAYFAGTWFGKHKLAPQISPNKTIEGSIAGQAAALIVFLIASIYANKDYPLSFLIICGICCGGFSQFGDLAMSMAKRQFNVKDFSSILPGHGGVLDRIDALLFSFSSVYCLMRFYGI